MLARKGRLKKTLSPLHPTPTIDKTGDLVTTDMLRYSTIFLPQFSLAIPPHISQVPEP